MGETDLTFEDIMSSKYVKSFEEFLSDKKKEFTNDTRKKIDWVDRKDKWLASLDSLYALVDEKIVAKFEKAGYNVKTVKEDTRIAEDYIGAYTTYNYIVEADGFRILFNPVGTIVVGANGRVNMVMPRETVVLVTPDWDNWKIVKGFGPKQKLVDFDEANLMEVFSESL